MPRGLAVVAFALGAALVAATVPLVAYAGSLALFGLPHVLAELRYVDGRFGRRLPRGQVGVLLGLLALAVGLRAVGLLGGVEPVATHVAELGVVAVMAFVAVPPLAASPGRAAVALLVGAALALGSWWAPLLTLVLLAVLHNLTPVGFLLERLGGTHAARPLAWALPLVFVAVPLALASGAPASLLAGWGLAAPQATFASVGPLAAHRGVFVPAPWLAHEGATHLFSAVAYLQLLHYGVVLLVLPRLLAAGEGAIDQPLLPWPRASRLALVTAGVGLLALVGFVQDFRGTRAGYGLVAAVHAWIEVPLLLLALAPAQAFRAARAP